ncbi:dihydrofolate reductase [Alkalicella caledoniensis]|nr:dihydrofolate reductase [Alkalicella caledoniensis]
MNISMIVAMGRGNVIGKDNKMPWNLPADLKYFKDTTMGHVVVCGRKTLLSMNGPLKGRKNIVLTKDRDFTYPGCEILNSVEELLRIYDKKSQEIFIIGGAKVYEQFLPLANKLYITYIDEDFVGDTYFPEFSLKKWVLVSERDGITNETNPYKYIFKVYQRLDEQR